MYIAPVDKPIVDEKGNVTPSKNGKEKYYKTMPAGYKGRYNGKDDYLREVSDEEISEWFDEGFGLAVITKGWSEKYRKYQRIFDIDSFGEITKEQFWEKYADALSGNFVTESFKGYHVFVFSDTEIAITKFTVETNEGDTLQGEIRYGTKSGHTVEPPSLSVNDSKWIINGEYKVANVCEEPGDLPGGWAVTNFSANKGEAQKLESKDRVGTLRNIIEGTSKKGQGQGIYNENLAVIGSAISKIKDKDDPDQVKKALKKAIDFNSQHAEGYSDKEVRNTFFDILEKEYQKTKMNQVEVDMETVRRAGGHVVQDTTDGAVYIQIDGKHNHLLGGKNASRWITKVIEPKDKAQLSNLLLRLDANIEQQVKLGYRIVRNADNAVCYNIGDDDGTTVTIGARGWEYGPSPDVALFKPCSGSKKQALPIRGGSVYDIFEFVNIKPELRELFLCILIYYFIPNNQYPILAVYGSKGSGKSTVAGMIRSLVDPNQAQFDTIDPKKIEDARVALSSSYLSVIDNISYISQEVSDLLCVLATGGAHRKRSLYTDGDVHLSQIVKPMVLTSVSQEIKREDLLSRTVLIEVEPLEEKKSATEIEENFQKKLPSILGAIFDVISQLRIEDVSKEGLVRMSDFHLYSRAIGKVLGFEVDGVIQANFEIQEEEAISNNDTGEAVRVYMMDKQEEEKTASEWVQALSEIDPTFKKKQPNWFARDMRRLKEPFSMVGISVEFSRDSDARTIKIAHIEKNPALSEAEHEWQEFL